MNFYVFIGFGVQKFCIFLLCYGAVVVVIRPSVYRKNGFHAITLFLVDQTFWIYHTKILGTE